MTNTNTQPEVLGNCSEHGPFVSPPGCQFCEYDAALKTNPGEEDDWQSMALGVLADAQKNPTTPPVETAAEATPRPDNEWFVGPRPLDVLHPHVPGFEVNAEEDAEWKAIARTREIGQQICDAVNAYDSQSSRLAEAEKRAIAAEMLADSLGHPVESPCGHSGQYAYSEDGGKNIRCLLCVEVAAEKEIEELKTKNARLERFARNMEETVDNVREAMGFESTHWQVLPGEVELMRKRYEALQKANAGLVEAIVKTLNDNMELADGDICTLIDLKRAVPGWEPPKEGE